MSLFSRAGKILRAELGARLSALGARLQNGAEPGTESSGRRRRAERTTRGDSSAGTGGSRRADGGPGSSASSPASGADAELRGYYANLEVPYGADLATVEAAWKRLQRKYHPDLHGKDPARQKTATEIVKGLNRAYEAIKKHHGR